MPGTGAKFIQDIFSGIHITIMHTATPRTNPIPYSRACDTFRPRIGQNATIRTGLGCIALADFFKPCVMPNGLVREFVSKSRPSSIKNRLDHGGLGQACGVHVAHRNIVKLTHDAGAELVVKIIAAIRYLRVYRRHTFLFIRALSNSQRRLSAPVNALRLNFLARGQRGEVFQAQVNADTLDGPAGAGRNSIDFNDDVQKPVAPAVAGEARTVLDFPVWQGAAVKNAEGITRKAKGVAFALELPALEQHPSERPFAPVAQVRPRLLAARLGVLLAHGIDRARVQAKLFAAASGQFVQIEPAVPGPAKAQGVLLPVIAVVLDEIAGPTLRIKQASQGFHPVSVDRNHFCFFRKSSTARRISSETETSNFLESSRNRSKAGSGRNKCVRFIHTLYQQTQQPDSFAAALYLPGLKAGVSREFNA